jgi:hypothetical protein
MILCIGKPKTKKRDQTWFIYKKKIKKNQLLKRSWIDILLLYLLRIFIYLFFLFFSFLLCFIQVHSLFFIIINVHVEWKKGEKMQIVATKGIREQHVKRIWQGRWSHVSHWIQKKGEKRERERQVYISFFFFLFSYSLSLSALSLLEYASTIKQFIEIYLFFNQICSKQHSSVGWPQCWLARRSHLAFSSISFLLDRWNSKRLGKWRLVDWPQHSNVLI